jgi:hypothetical protein
MEPSHEKSLYRPDVNEYNELNTILRAGIFNAYTIWTSDENTNPYKNETAVRTWHTALQGVEKADIGKVKAMVEDILRNEPDREAFKTFLVESLPNHLKASWPDSSHATICSLLESMHNRLAKLEASASFKTKSII